MKAAVAAAAAVADRPLPLTPADTMLINAAGALQSVIVGDEDRLNAILMIEGSLPRATRDHLRMRDLCDACDGVLLAWRVLHRPGPRAPGDEARWARAMLDLAAALHTIFVWRYVEVARRQDRTADGKPS